MNIFEVMPSATYVPPSSSSYPSLERIEDITRTCYKSEERKTTGSAQSLIRDVVLSRKHESVLEHENCVIRIAAPRTAMMAAEITDMYGEKVSPSRRMFATRMSVDKGGHLLVSGNLRMWKHYYDEVLVKDGPPSIIACLHEKWPFFFDRPNSTSTGTAASLVNDDPATCEELTPAERLLHLTMTYRTVMDRAASHQLVRHRYHAAYSQESQRYVNYSKKCGYQYLVPPSVTEEFRPFFVDQLISCFSGYEEALSKLRPEDARRLLPNATKTEVVATMPLGMWRHFHVMRTDNSHAEWCIRVVGHQIVDHQKTLIPWLFDA